MIIDDDDVGVEAVGTNVDIEAVEDSPAQSYHNYIIDLCSYILYA